METARNERVLSSTSVIGGVQRQARGDNLVGRSEELNRFRQILAGSLPRIVFVHGPGGIGKSSLLAGFQTLAEDRGYAFGRLDGRQIAATPAAVDSALSSAARELRANAPRVLALDHCEKLTALDGWLREAMLPRLPTDMVVVFASRHGPGAAWRADPGINALLLEIAVTPLRDAAVTHYLAQRAIVGAQAAAVRSFSRGIPLALALAADRVLRDRDRPFDIDELPDLIRSLVQWLLQDVDRPQELAALQACATVRRLDEPLLAHMLDAPDVAAAFSWLAEQHFVELQTHGLVMHDLVRDIVVRDLRSRNVNRHRQLIRRAVDHALAGADTLSSAFRLATVPELVYTLRHEPHIQEHMGFGELSCYPDRLRADDRLQIAAAIAHHEGDTSRRWFEHWLAAETSECVVLRDAREQAVAFALMLQLEADDLAAARSDPAIAALANALDERAPLRERERVLLARFRMACQTHQALTPAWAELSAHLNGRMFTPGISMLASVADMRYRWHGMDDNAEYHLLEGSRYRIDNCACMISAHDLRAEPALEWAYNSVERVLRDGASPDLVPEPLVLFNKADFKAAVRHALQVYGDTSALADSPLLRSTMLRRYARKQCCDSLRELFAETSRALSHNNRRVLETAFFAGSGVKRQAVAADLCMSERTLRRHLRDAETQLFEALWRRETTP